MNSSVCLVAGRRRVTGLIIGTSQPRQLGFHAQVRLLSTARSQRVRSLPVRDQIPGLSGNSRSYWWSSSKTTSAPKEEATTTPEDVLSDSAVASVQAPTDTATFIESTNVAEASAVLDSAPLPDVPVGSISSAAADAISTIPLPATPPPPLNYGDLAALGLGGWSPIGLCQLGIESLQVFTGMPWFWTIVTASVVSRLVLFPFGVMGMRNAALMAPHQPEFLALREEIMAARASKDPMRMNKAVMKQRVLYDKIGVSMSGMFLPAVIQVPVTLGMFFGVKRMCDLPVEQLKYSGLDILPDLTALDPTWILPIVATAAINLQLSLSVGDMTASNPNAGHMINLFRGLSIVGLIFMGKLSTGVLVYLLSTSIFMSIQSAIMRVPAVRRYFGIPVIPKHLRGKAYSMLESIQYAKDAFMKKRAEAQQEAANRTRRR